MSSLICMPNELTCLVANILRIPAPTAYHMTAERTSTPPSHKLGLYRTKGKDGKEGGKLRLVSIDRCKIIRFLSNWQ